jgi:hypothetical protein
VGRVYHPKIYGFRVSERAKSGPRMGWLRIRPESLAELDQVDWRGRWVSAEEDDDDVFGEGSEGHLENFDDEPDADEEDDEEEQEEDDQAPAPAPNAKGTSRQLPLSNDWAAEQRPIIVSRLPSQRFASVDLSDSDSTALDTPDEEVRSPRTEVQKGTLSSLNVKQLGVEHYPTSLTLVVS